MLKKVLCIAVVGLFAIGIFSAIGRADIVQPEGTVSPVKSSMYTPHAPIRINSDAEFNASFSNRTIWGYEINGTGVGYCIYIGNCSLPFTVKDCYLHDASGVFSPPYFQNAGLSLFDLKLGNVINNNMSSNEKGGISLYTSSSNLITNNKVSNNDFGVSLQLNSNGNIIANNTASFASEGGIYLETSHVNTIVNNNASNSSLHGIYLINSNNNNIANNTASSNDYDGLYITGSAGNTITNNTLSSNGNSDIFLFTTGGNTLANNTMVGVGINIWGSFIEQWNKNTIDSSNTLCGKPVLYWKNQIGGTMPLGAGQIILANCTGVTAMGQDVSSAYIGINVGFSDHNYIYSNIAKSNREFGIFLYKSDGNTVANNTVSLSDWGGINIDTSHSNIIANNTVSSNNVFGISLSYSSRNKIYHNNFISNTKQATDETGTNFWNASYPTGGNYWSDWTSPDNNTDGIVDFPYFVDGGKGARDYFPLTTPPVPPPVPESPPPTLILILFVILPLLTIARKRSHE